MQKTPPTHLSSERSDLLHLRAPVWTLIRGEEQQPPPSRAGTDATPARCASSRSLHHFFSRGGPNSNRPDLRPRQQQARSAASAAGRNYIPGD